MPKADTRTPGPTPAQYVRRCELVRRELEERRYTPSRAHTLNTRSER